ncbi:MAG: metallophosphoesterase family protein [Planctomycetes bacterium]|nr:metallophosphoesterase family protein [Planctomycetota bacterium]
MIAVISDLHSNIQALSRALEDIAELGVTRIACLGDVVGYGANPRECLQLVMERCEFTLLGNHEDAMMNFAEDFNDNARAAIHWTQDRLNAPEFPADQNFAFWNFLGELPHQVETDGALFVHGSPRDPVREYMLPRDARNPDKMERVFAAQTQPVSFVGHSHVPGVYVEGGEKHISPRELENGIYVVPKDRRVLVNVGSVGQPRDGDPRLSYVIFEPAAEGRAARIAFRRLAYDHEAASRSIRAEQGLPVYLAERLLVGR